jgi:2-hydroxy-3-oxopropionate reductase
MLDNLGPQVIAKDARGLPNRPPAQGPQARPRRDLRERRSATGLALTSVLYLEARGHGEGVNGNQALFRTFDRMSNQADIVTSGE